MLDHKFEAHRYKNTYYTNYCAVSSVLSDLRSMPLQLDKISLSAPGDKPFKKSNFFQRSWFSTKRFFNSFVDVYGEDEINSKDEKTLTIWVNWGRDQVQVLKALLDRDFTPKTGIKVNVKLVNASIVQAVLSGKGPDVVLQHARTEPVNLAMRGVLTDLTQFPDYKEVLSRFADGADIPYWYKDGLYALPDTQSFYVLFYRKDILEEFDIDVPKTWDEFELAAKLLMRNNMNVCMPSAANPNAAAASGVTTAGLFPTLLLQSGLGLYTENGQSTTLLDSESAEVFESWTNYYTKLKVPISMDFYNRFRTGTTPIGISTYNLYTTLKVAAPEIDGLWGMTKIPGTVRKDGTISHASAGNGTSCSILKMSEENGRADEAWELLKWWTSAEVQHAFSNDVETILGPAGRVSVANKEALSNLTWDDGALEALQEARDEVTEIPEYPGSYYVQRSIYQAYWNVVSNDKNTKDMLMKFGTEANNEITRKWQQYTNRG
jgi:ABC-type glycerol-3-phosphate transport system substrate-binding protein